MTAALLHCDGKNKPWPQGLQGIAVAEHSYFCVCGFWVHSMLPLAKFQLAYAAPSAERTRSSQAFCAQLRTMFCGDLNSNEQDAVYDFCRQVTAWAGSDSIGAVKSASPTANRAMNILVVDMIS